jgi:hypothetical protein
VIFQLAFERDFRTQFFVALWIAAWAIFGSVVVARCMISTEGRCRLNQLGGGDGGSAVSVVAAVAARSVCVASFSTQNTLTLPAAHVIAGCHQSAAS